MSMHTIDDDGLFTIRDVAERYAVHPKTIDKLLADRKIPAPVEGWPGSDRRWLRSEVVAHIRAMKKRDEAEQAS